MIYLFVATILYFCHTSSLASHATIAINACLIPPYLQHFQENGACAFGTSCFYRHVRQDGTIEEKTGPNIIYNSLGTTEVKKETKLSDYIRFR